MNENAKDSTAYKYIEDNYREEWEKQKTLFGSSNRWKQFESSFNTNYADFSAGCSYGDIFDTMKRESAELRDLYYEIHETPKAERISINDDEKALSQLHERAAATQRAQISDQAALQAFEIIAPYTGMDRQSIDAEKNTAYDKALEENNAQTIEQLAKNLEKKAKRGEGIEYLVRGAPMRCLYGSHMRYLDMLETHGVYLGDKALIHANDCKVDENIFSFGICSCPKTTLTEKVTLVKGADVDHDGNYINALDEQVLTGIVCKPTINGIWRNIKEDTQIADDAAEGIEGPSGATCYGAVTNASYLLCKEGGFIMPLTSGQLNYTSYFAEFLNYPFEDIGSPAFFKWCDLKGICPYFPGTVDYTKWYQDQIGSLKSLNKIKKTYADYLDKSYQYGLDNMVKDRQKEVDVMLGQYLDLLNDQEASQEKEKYSGLRINYSYNDQKNITGVTPHDDAYYQHYIDEANDYNKQIQELYDESMRLIASHSYEYADKANKMVDVKKQKEETLARFTQEMERYEGKLGTSEKELEQAVIDAFRVSVNIQE